MSDLTVQQSQGDLRIDSQAIAGQLGNQHKNVLSLIRSYESDFAELGRVAFQTRTFGTAGGTQKGEVALLNEDQCYLLLTYSRNTLKVRKLKVALIKVFRDARQSTAVTDVQYLPLYREMHEEVRLLAHRAEECGSKTPERIFHINANKAINSVMGIAAGGRGELTLEQRLLLTNVQFVFRRALHDSLESGDNHKDAARKAKEAALSFVQHAGQLLIGSKAA
jgi:phage regulator Rha-like protein